MNAKRRQRSTFLIGLVALLVAAYSLTFLFLLSGCAGKKKETIQQVAQPESPVRPAPEPLLMDTVGGAQQGPLWGWIKKEAVNVRDAPSTKGKILTKLKWRSEVKLLERINDWWKVEISDTQTAYVSASLITEGRYIDPWTQFKFGCRLADSSLKVIVAVEKYQNDKAPSAFLTVSDNWGSIAKEEQERIAGSAFNFWSECVGNAGFQEAEALLILRNSAGDSLVSVNFSGLPNEKPIVTFLK